MKRTPSFRWSIAVVATLGLVACGGGDVVPGAAADPFCAALNGKAVPGVASVSAVAVAANAAVPAYCRVYGHILPNLNFELRLPQRWNNKLHYAGGGGYGGGIPGLNDRPLAALLQGYATVSSNSGHEGMPLDASFALNDPQAAALFGSQSVPTVMAAAKALLQSAYGTAPTRSYFEGCSGGGREGLMSAQRDPNLFDGVVARAPAYNWVGLMGAFNRTAKALAVPGGQLSAPKLQRLAQAVRDRCDALDGVADGVVSNPSACAAAFDPATLRCVGGGEGGDACLSDAQLRVVTSWTTPAVFAGSATYRNPGWNLTGNEDDPGAWSAWVTGGGDLASALQFQFQDTTVKYYLARDPAANSLAYTWDQDLNALNAMATLNDATDTDLRPFSARGAKLILWHGGNDAALSVNATTAYYTTAVSAAGGQAAADTFLRYYVAPGVDHCSGGPGADSTDLLTALDDWVSGRTPPEVLSAQRSAADGSAELTRPLCRYPQYPRYVGPVNDAAAARLAANYRCTTP